MPIAKGVLINGDWRSTDEASDVINPFDNTVIGTYCLCGAREIEDAVNSSVAAFEVLRRMPSYKKAEVISRVIEGIKQRGEDLARTIVLESGKPIKDARVEVIRACNTFQIALEESKRLGGEVLPLDIMQGSEDRIGIVRRFPIGPVLGISSFNFPLNLVAHKVAPAMACGNPIILKPAPKTPLTALMLGAIITEAGWPAGGVNVVPCSNEYAQGLVEDERIKKLTFTGSAKVGWMLKGKAVMKKVTLELGGNAAVVIHDDADIEYAAHRCVVGAFSYSGQICVSVQRIYVHRPVFGKFKELFIENCKRLKSGDPLDESTDIGPLIDESAAIRTEEWVKEAEAMGARVITGGRRNGNFFEPTVLTETKPSMTVCKEEVFAPVTVLEPYDTFDEAVEEVNRSDYGLQAGIFTNDMSRIFHAFGRLDVGGVIVNDIPIYRVDNMPYGGVKMSGCGREGVRFAIDEMTELKILTLKV